MIDVSADAGYLTTSLTIMNMLQCIKQANWPDVNTLLMLPKIKPRMLPHIRYKVSIDRLPQSGHCFLTLSFRTRNCAVWRS